MPTGYNTLDEYVRKMNEALASDKAKATENYNALYANQVKSVNDAYGKQISDASASYEDSYRANAIQKLINERQVAENMANLGLTDSGLNRTQQTAVQLSYANNKANIDKQKRSAIDSLEAEKLKQLSTIEQNKLATLADLENTYSELATKYGTEAYNADIKAEQERAEKIVKAQEDAAKQKKSDFNNIFSSVSDEEKSKSAKLAEIYNYAVDYDLDLSTKSDSQGNLDVANSTFENAEISRLLASAGISLAEWRIYVLQKYGYDANSALKSALNTSNTLRRSYLNPIANNLGKYTK